MDDDEDELHRFVRMDYPMMVAALGLVCGSRPAAEDAVQEALAKAVLFRRRGRRIESLPAWVRVVALNLLRNRWRSLAREAVAFGRLGAGVGGSRGDDVEADACALDVTRAVASLPRRQREAVALHYTLGLSVADTATSMGVTDGTVKTLLSRARTALAVKLGDQKESRA